MPVYEAYCPKCGKKYDYVKPIEQRNDTPMCCNCKTERVILTPPFGFVDTPAAG